MENDIELLEQKNKRDLDKYNARTARTLYTETKRTANESNRALVSICPHVFYLHWADEAQKPRPKYHAECLWCEKKVDGSLHEIKADLFKLQGDMYLPPDLPFSLSQGLFLLAFQKLATESLIPKSKIFFYSKIILQEICKSNKRDDIEDNVSPEEIRIVKQYIGRYK